MATSRRMIFTLFLTLLVCSLFYKEINAECDGQHLDSCKEPQAPPPETTTTTTNEDDNGDVIPKDFDDGDEFDAEVFVLGH